MPWLKLATLGKRPATAIDLSNPAVRLAATAAAYAGSLACARRIASSSVITTGVPVSAAAPLCRSWPCAAIAAPSTRKEQIAARRPRNSGPKQRRDLTRNVTLRRIQSLSQSELVLANGPPIIAPLCDTYLLCQSTICSKQPKKLPRFLNTLNKLGGMRLKYRISASDGVATGDAPAAPRQI